MIVLPGGKIGFAEMKRPKTGKTRHLQDKQMLFLQKLGFIAKVIDSEEGIEKFIKEVINK